MAKTGEFSFLASDPTGTETYPAMELRRKIALQMIANSGKKGYPKTLGEGLASIGDAIGDIGMMRMLQGREAAYAKQAAAAAQTTIPEEARTSAEPPITSPRSSYAPADDEVTAPEPAAKPPEPGVSSEDTNVTPDITPAEMATARTQTSSPLSPVMASQQPLTMTPTGNQPWSMFRPQQMNPPGMAVAPAGGNAAGFKEPNLSEAPPAAAPGPQSNATPAHFANVRYNNPGAQYPGPDATNFGSTGTGIIGGGHKIAQFPTPMHGAAANFALLDRGYTGMPIGAAITKWSGGGRGEVPGYDSSQVITKDMVRDPNFAVPFLKAVARGEAPGEYPMSSEQWRTAHKWFTQGAPDDRAASQAAAPAALQQRSEAEPAQPMAFSGLPPEPPAGDARDAITQALVRGSSAQAVPPPNPTTSPPVTAATPVGSPPESASNPPIPFAGTQVAQNAPQPQQPPPTPQRLTPQPRQPILTDVEMTPDEKRGWQIKARGMAMQDPIITQQGEDLIKYGAGQRQQEYQARLKDWSDQMALQHQRQLAEEAFARTQGTPEHASEVQLKAQEADVARRFGGPVPYQQFNMDMSKAHDAVQPLANTLPMYDQAKDALKNAYTGTGAELKLDASKMLRAMGVPGDYSPSVATEILRSRMSAIAAGFVKGTVGSTNISNQDVAFVEKAYSGHIDMEPESLRKLLNIAQEAAIKTVNQHNDRLLSVANDPVADRGLRNMYRVPMQYGGDADILKQQGQNPKIREYFDQKYGKGHANAVLGGKPYGE